MWNDGPGAVTVSSYINGWDETAITDEQLAQIEADWIAQKPLNAFYWSGEYTDLCPAVQDGTVWVAYAWQGCYATALADGDPVAYANPEEGRNSWVGLYGISAETDSYELALEFLDNKLAETSCSNAVTLFYYGCANGEVMAAIDDPVLIEAFSLDDPTILETTNFTPNVTAGAAGRVDRDVGASPGRIGAEPADAGGPQPMLGRRGTLPFLVGPPLVWLALFFLLPLVLIAAYSIRAGSGAVGPSDPWVISPEHYQEVFGTPAFMRLLGISVLMAVGIAGLATLLAYPVAYFLTFRAGSRAPLYLTLLLIPFAVSYLLRVMAWKLMLGPEGGINSLLGTPRPDR